MVLKLDIENRQCLVEERECSYYTDAVVKIDLKVLSEDEHFGGSTLPCTVGDLLVRSQAEKFKKIRFNTHENVGYGEIYLPPEEMQTRALMVLFPKESPAGEALVSYGDELTKAGVLSGISYLARSLAPAELMCDPSDLGATWRVRDDHFGVPAIYIWDRYPGGTGLSEALAPTIPTLLRKALDRVGSCDCDDGCPSCIGLFDPVNGGNKPKLRKAKVCLMLAAAVESSRTV